MPFLWIPAISNSIGMKQTGDSVFLDTNILVYAYSNSELEKQSVARKLIVEKNGQISTQVLQELVNTVTKKFNFSLSDAKKAVVECCNNSSLHINGDSTIVKACELAEIYKYSFYDCLIISAALESGCKVLFTEDMHHNQIIEERLTIVNPFI